jgi:hypothetical protein
MHREIEDFTSTQCQHLAMMTHPALHAGVALS